jgi:hypothetical protein
MNEQETTRIEIGDECVEFHGDEGEWAHIGSNGIHIKDGDAEVRINWAGIRIKDGKASLNLTIWKPLIGCATAILLFVALLTAIVAGIIRLFLG